MPDLMGFIELGYQVFASAVLAKGWCPEGRADRGLGAARRRYVARAP